MKENLGILLSVSSLPSRHGMGDFGEDAYRFIRYLRDNNYYCWQILPINPLGPGESPYMSTCSQAIDFRYINLDLVKKDGYIKGRIPNFLKDNDAVWYNDVKEFKLKWLRKAYEEYKRQQPSCAKIKRFIKENDWAIYYGTFEVLKARNGLVAWNEWRKEDRDYFLNHKKPPRKLMDEIYFIIFMQMIARKQWLALFEYAHKCNVKIIADMPFYVGFDSIDTWLHRDQFLITAEGKQLAEGGVPPDAFSDVGQKWGSPIYNFEAMEKDGFSLMVKRTGELAKMCDMLRIDHFRAFDTYYVIPAGMPDAKIGEWKIGPRQSFFDKLYEKYPDINLIAEDLGDLVPSVLELRDYYHFPGMYIVEFNICDYSKYSNNNMIVYPGTHDNETLLGWLKGRNQGELDYIKQKVNCWDDDKLFDAIVNYTMNLPSLMTIFPLQDLLKLDNDARFNTPGTVGWPNWVWKLKDWKWVKDVRINNK